MPLRSSPARRGIVPALAAACLLTSPLPAQTDGTIVVGLGAQPTPISKFIYGYNFGTPAAGDGFTVSRSGGNRLTGYNWETNASNAGSDYLQHSDNYLVSGLPYAQQSIPGEMMRVDYEAAKAYGRRNIVTLQLAGYVAADEAGTVTAEQTAPSSRWDAVVWRKPTALSLTPDTTDGTVYLDEEVNWLVQNFGTAGNGGVWAYSLDNEPALWPSTHPRIHPAALGVQELIDRDVAGASVVKDLDPSALVFGPALYGWNAYASLQDAPDWSSFSGQYDWFISAYLAKMKAAEATAGHRLLDVLDLHWYPEASGGGVRITPGNTTAANVEARLQAPRSLWDPTYTETSWITQYSTLGPIQLLPRVKQSIASYYPGTKLGFTEYDYGGHNHYSGGLATADALGVFGREGVFEATYWGELTPFMTAPFRLYRNYDGQGGQYGDEAYPVVVSSNDDYSAFASTSSQDGRVHLIVINKAGAAKSLDIQVDGGGRMLTGARVYGFGEAGGSAITERAPVESMSGNELTYTLPSHSALHFVFEELQGDVSAKLTGNAAKVHVTARATVGQSYEWQWSSDLQQWTNGDPFQATAGSASIDLDAPASAPLFVRLAQVAQ